MICFLLWNVSFSIFLLDYVFYLWIFRGSLYNLNTYYCHLCVLLLAFCFIIVYSYQQKLLTKSSVLFPSITFSKLKKLLNKYFLIQRLLSYSFIVLMSFKILSSRFKTLIDSFWFGGHAIFSKKSNFMFFNKYI